MEMRICDGIARCLDYPQPATSATARAVADRVAGDHAGLAHTLWDLAIWLETGTRGEAEERYASIFDLNPACTLNLGYHVFGDSYPRGELLAGLAVELRQVEVAAPRGELPDYLPTLLRLLPRLADAEDRALLLRRVVLPALARLAEAAPTAASPWSALLRALPAWLGEAFREELAAHPEEVVAGRAVPAAADSERREANAHA